MNALTLNIANIAIRQDANGRFCLNDLHKASGNDPKYKPANFIRLDTTQALIKEINQCSDLRSALEVINGGPQRGSYGCKELVYAYAMWISAKFHIAVIHAYDALVTGQRQADPNDYASLQSKYVALLEQEIARLKTPTISAPFGTPRSWTPAEDASLLAMKAQGFGDMRIGFALGRGCNSVKHRRSRLEAAA